MEHLDHPSPNFNDVKMARFCAFIIALGERGLIVSFYSVQDCRSTVGRESTNFRLMHIRRSTFGRTIDVERGA